MKLFFIVAIFVAFICIIEENAAADIAGTSEKKYEPFIVMTSLPPTSETDSETETTQASHAYEIPSKFVIIDEEWRFVSESGFTSQVALCPDPPTSYMAKMAINILTQNFPGSDKCLYVRDFTNNEPQICNEEPQLALETAELNDLPVICGVNGNQRLVDAVYYNCSTMKNLEDYANEAIQDQKRGEKKPPPFERHNHHMYEICYDFDQRKTLWTRHTPKTIELLTHRTRLLSNEITTREFSTDISNLKLPPTTFSDLKQSYESIGLNSVIMYTLVPEDHMALLYWKKSTFHMINSAPLLSKFISLMLAINDGIFQASRYLFKQSNKILQIYTRVETKVSVSASNFTRKRPFASTSSTTLAWFKPTLSASNSFEPNTWYQLIHDADEKSGVLIVLHNTPDEVPDQKECEEDERTTCDFNNWSFVGEPILHNVLNHAYCCKITKERVKSLFFIEDFDLENVFDIQKAINAA